MLQLLNQTSYVLPALVVLAVATGIALRAQGSILLRAGVLLVVATVLLAVPLALRTGRGTVSVAEVDALLGAGKPVLLEFYSDF